MGLDNLSAHDDTLYEVKSYHDFHLDNFYHQFFITFLNF